MKQIESSANRAERATGGAMAGIERSFQKTQQSSRLLGYQISDIGTQLAAGTSPFLILAQQGPQVANALDGAGGAVGRFAGFLSGPWGAAMLTAVSLLGVFIGKNLQSGESVDDLVEKLKKQESQTKLSEEADTLFAKSLEGVEKAAKDAEEAVEALRLANKSEAEQAEVSIKASLKRADALRADTRATLEKAKAVLAIRAIEASDGANNPD